MGMADNGASAGDIGRAVLGAGRDALQGVADTLRHVDPTIPSDADIKNLGVDPKEVHAASSLPEVSRADESRPGGAFINASRDVGKFILGFIGAGSILKGAGVASGVGERIAAAGLGDFLVAGPHDPRLIDFLTEYPSLKDSVLGALADAGKGDDFSWTRKIEQAGEGMLTAGALEGVVKLVGVLRNVVSAQRVGDPAVIQRAVSEGEEELQGAYEVTQKAFHGSGADFGKFDMSKVGTGEGSQAFGHGHYVAENPVVAQFYKDRLGPDVVRQDATNLVWDLRDRQASHWPDEQIADAIKLQLSEHPEYSRLAAAMGADPELESAMVGAVKSEKTDNMKHVHSYLSDEKLGGGNLYEVNVKAGNDQMLDWDKPLEEQSSRVQEIIARLENEHGLVRESTGETGETFYTALADKLGSEKAASEALQEAGIPGHRFLDAGSRDTGGGTHNMVIYHDDGLEITAKNGEPVEMKTNGDTFQHSNGTSPLPLSDTAKAEIAAATKDGASAKFEDLSEATQAEVKDFIGKHPELMPTPKMSELTKYEPTFKLDEAKGAEFQKALDTSLSVPYATLRAENPGTALEDTLGNFFNYHKMTGPDEVKASLSDLARLIAPKVNELGGGEVQTFQHVTEMADWFGTKPDVLMGTLKQLAGGGVDMAAMVRAGKIWAQSLTNDILRIVRSANAGLATDADKLKLVQMKDVLVDLVGLTKNVQRSAARTISAARMPTGVIQGGMEAGDREALRGTLDSETYKFVDNLLSLSDGSPKSVIKLLDPTLGQKAMGVLHEAWVNFVLSRVVTQVVNITGNMRNTFLYPLYRLAGGALTGDSQSLQLGLAQYGALRNSIFDSADMARRAFMSNAPILDSAAQQLEGQRGWIKAGTFGAQDESIFGTGINWLGTTINTPSRFLTTADEFFGQLNYRTSVEARARVDAVQQGLSTKADIEVLVNGEKRMVSQADQYVSKAMDDAFNPQTLSGYAEDGSLLNSKAMGDSRRSKFTQPLKNDANWLGAQTSLGEVIHNAAARIPLFAHFVAPFTKVPTNLFREMVNESPLAPIRAQFWHDVQAGGEARSDAIGRLSLGSAFSIGIGMLAAEGFVTGQGPGDPDRQRQWRSAGNIPYSFRLPGQGENGKDAFIPYNRLDPVAGIVGMIADAQYIMAHTDERTQNKIATTIGLSFANNLNSKGYLQSMTDLMAALKGSRDGDSGAKAFQKLIDSRMASYVPAIVSSFKADDTMREVRDWMDAVMNKIPGLSAGLEPLYDNLGEPMVLPQGWPWREVNPFTLAVGKSGPARTEMNHWGEGPTATKFMMPHPSVGGVIDLRDYKDPTSGQTAFSRWMQLVSSPIFNGKTTEQDLDAFVQSEGYKSLKKNGVEDPIYHNHPAAEAIREQLATHYKIAHDQMLSEPGFENLRGALQQFSAGQRTVPLGAPPPSNPTLQDLLNKK